MTAVELLASNFQVFDFMVILNQKGMWIVPDRRALPLISDDLLVD